MFEQINDTFSKVTIFDLNILLLLGIALFGGTLGGKVFQKIRMPQVVGYIIVGLIVGRTGFNIIDEEVVNMLQPFNYFALGMIGFMIGNELKRETFRKHGKHLIIILFFEAFVAFVMVALFVYFVGGFFFSNTNHLLAMALLLGAIASATAPAATTDVLWECKARGPLTTTVLSIVAMDDGLALFLFAITSSIAGSLFGQADNINILDIIIGPAYEITVSILLGVISGLILGNIVKRTNKDDRALAFAIGTILLVIGIALALHVDSLLACMALGATICNYLPQKSKGFFKLIEKFTPPIYVLFFVLFGAKLQLNNITLPIGVIAVAYLIGRTGGKSLGAYFGARISGAAESVRKYLPYCLFSQAGVAIGLSILVSQRFPNEVGDVIVMVITVTTFVVQIIGPVSTKLAVMKSGEAGLNVTEEDIFLQSKAMDIMDKNIPLIYEDMLLPEILDIFNNCSHLYFPVVNRDKYLLGILTVDNLKNTFTKAGLDNLLLAHDIMEPITALATPETPMTEVKQILEDNRLDYLPVVTRDNKIEGFLESRTIQRLISARIVEMQNKTSSIG
ncbi:MAG: cation:proton antiporter domain-containing protein [Candidatus Anammoxibacter sp.]